MSATTRPNPFVPLHPAMQERFFRLTVADYHEMGATGILTTEDRVELLDGYLVTKPMQKSKHAFSIQRITEELLVLIPSAYRFRCQIPITLQESEPEPDFVIAKGDRNSFASRHPQAAEIALVIEVSDTTLRLDREIKGPIYARAGIPIYWIINLVDLQIEVHTQPTQAGYQQTQNYTMNDRIPIMLGDTEIASVAVSEIIPE